MVRQYWCEEMDFGRSFWGYAWILSMMTLSSGNMIKRKGAADVLILSPSDNETTSCFRTCTPPIYGRHEVGTSSVHLLTMLLFCFFLIVCLVLAKEDCDKFTREDRCNEIFNNIEYCNQESYRPQLMDCLVTCGKCGAFSCNNPLPETSLNCTALASQCNSTVWERFMKEKCPATCGKCDVKNANLCKDASDSTICSTMVVSGRFSDFTVNSGRPWTRGGTAARAL
ncbi:hypothetical protein Y032_0853g2696 [Ancylostoma ceylanicum]|uniref:ShKT domain-containing protein n=1 Tax=Ancylostoma ceylanicum TaxID=53326 RepID=A0A016WC14_9BILA|nr:hypothetical protein Y032_0853g2696 [Ancylostoma ceylanicum]